MARNYGRENERRNERAQEAGWASYGQKRYAHNVVGKSKAFRYYEEKAGYLEDKDEAIKAMYMMRREGENDYGKDSWHYYFLVEVMGYMTEEEWDAAYENGVRSYGTRR